MINANELLFVVNEFDEAVEPLPRHKTHREKHWHRAAHIWVTNSKGQLLCQKRSMLKETAAGLWEPCVGGHVTHGDDYFSGAIVELREETGIAASKSDLHLVKIYQDHESREFRAIFIYKTDVSLSEIQKEEAEVDEVKWIDLEEFFSEIGTDTDKDWIRTGYEKEIISTLFK